MNLRVLLAKSLVGSGLFLVGCSGIGLPSSSPGWMSYNYHDNNNDGKMQVTESRGLNIQVYNDSIGSGMLTLDIVGLSRKLTSSDSQQVISPYSFKTFSGAMHMLEPSKTLHKGDYEILFSKDGHLVGRQPFTVYEDDVNSEMY